MVSGGDTYSVQILTQPQTTTQHCFVTNNSRTGTVTKNITTVAITCADVGRFAYVGSGGNLADANASSGIYGYRIDPAAGTLTPLAGSPFATPSPTSLSLAISVTPNGQVAYVANSSAKTITAYAINSVTGALVLAGGPYATATPTYTSKVDPSGKFAYFTSLSGHNVYAYAVDAVTGALTAAPGSPYTLSGSPTAFAINKSGSVAYIPFSGGATVNVASFNINPSTGALSVIAGSEVEGGSGIAIDPNERFAYTLDTTAKTVSTHPLNATTGVLGARIGTPISAGSFPNDIDIEPSGRFVLVTSGSVAAPGLLIYSVDPLTGALTAVPGSPFVDGGINDNPLRSAVDPSGKFIYVTNDISKNISAYTFSATTGVATAVAGSPFATGVYPDSIAIAK
jgi:6-phosphogluconolactonase (cycloisomerase 2 family)